MGRQPCCDKVGLKKGPWTADEDKKLISFILTNGQCCWRAVPKLAGLLRCGKSCRLRWTNYLRPDLKRGLLSEHEEKMVIDLHAQLGNRWSKIASHLAGRTDNEIKNHWNTHIKKKLKKMGIDPVTHKPLPSAISTDDQHQENQPENNIIDPGNEEPPAKTESPDSNHSNITSVAEMDQENKQGETSMQSSSITEAKEEEDKSISQSPSDFVQVNNGFCIDEVPLINPEEILVPYPKCSSSSISPSSSSSSSSSSFCYDKGSYNAFNQGFLPTFDWQLTSYDDYTNSMDFWDDDFISSLDMLINNNNTNNSDRNTTTTTLGVMGVETSPVLYPEMVLDEDSWKFALL